MKPLSVNRNRADDIHQISAISAGNIDAIVSSLSGHAISAGGDGLLDVFSDHVDGDAAGILLKHASSLCMLMDDYEVSAAEVLDALRRGLVRYGFSPKELTAFDNVAPSLQRLLESDTLYTSVKATSIFAADTYHLHQFKIYADARPVFDRRRQAVKGTLVFSTLHVVASDRREDEISYSICLRYKDLLWLRDECARAVDKIDQYAESLKKGDAGEVIKYGDAAL